MERNIKLFPYYKLFSYDMLFFYAISTLYLIEMKGLSITEVGLITSFYCLFCSIAQIPCSIICDKIGLKKSLVVGNALLILYCIGLIIFPNFKILLINEFICAIGFGLKGCSESPFIYSSLKKLGKENELSKVDGKGDTLYFILEAIACIVAGYLYKMNSYLPVVFAAICFVISSLIAYSFKPIPRSKLVNFKKEYFGEFISSFKFIFKSMRLRALFIYSFCFVGLINVAAFIVKAYLTELKASSATFGYIYAGMAICSALGATFQRRIECKLRNQTLSVINLVFITTIIFTGLFLFMPISTKTLIILGTIFFLSQALLKGCFLITIRVYLSRYTTSVIRPKIMSVYYLVAKLGAFTLLTLVATVTSNISLSISLILIGFVFFIGAILVASYMDKKVGLDPSKYTVKDRMDLLDDSNLGSDK